MKRAWLILMFAAVASAQSTLTTLTGTIRDLSGGVVKSGRITFTLNAPDTTIPGVGRFTPSTVYCKINASGSPVSNADGVSACTITANTALTPSGTSYAVCVQAYLVQPGGCFNFFAPAGQTIDISTIAPTLTTLPTNYAGIPGPTGATGPTGPAGPLGNGFSAATGTNGIANALAACTAGVICAVQAAPGVAQADTTQPTGVGQIVVNNSTGGNLVSIANPYGAAGGVGYLFGALNCYQSQLTQGANGGGSFYSPCNSINFTMSAPGPDCGYGSATPGACQGWHTSSAQTVTANFQGEGIAGLLEFNGHKYAIGDFIGLDMNFFCYGGRVAGSDEGCKTYRTISGETTTTYSGTIAAGTTNNTSLLLNSNGAVDNIGVPEKLGNGRFLLDQASSTGRMETITAIDSTRAQAIYDSTANWPVSPFSGTLAHAIVTANPTTYRTPQGDCHILAFSSHTGTAPIGPAHIIDFDSTRHDQGSTLATCPAWSATIPYNVGEGVSFGGQNYTSTVYNNLNSSPSGGASDNWTLETAPYQIAAYIRQSHEAGSMAWVDGMASHGMWFAANSNNPNGLVYPFEVLGSSDAHTLLVTQFYTDETALPNVVFSLGNVRIGSQPLQSVTVTSGVATIVQYNRKDPIFDQQQSVTITGNANSALNGRYAVPTDAGYFTGYGQVYTATLCTTATGTCTPSTYTGTGTGGNMTIGDTGFGNTRYTVGCMAQVIDVNNPATKQPDGNFALVEPNSCPFAVGSAVQEPHHYAMGMIQHAEGMAEYNPIPNGDVYSDINWTASGRTTGLGGPAALISYNQQMNLSTLAGFGGTGVAPNFANIFGAYSTMFNVAGMPAQSGNYLFDSVQNIPNYTNYPNYFWGVARVAMYNSSHGVTYCELANFYTSSGVVNIGDGCPKLQLDSPATFTQPATFTAGVSSTGYYNGSIFFGLGTSGTPPGLTAGQVGVYDNGGVLYGANGTSTNPVILASRQPMRWVGTITTTSASFDTFTAAVTTANHCIVQQLSNGVPVAPQVTMNAGSVTIYHGTTAGIPLDVSCDIP